MSQNNNSVIERFLIPNPQWQEGYKSFNQLFGKPLGFLYLSDVEGEGRLIRLDRKSYCSYYAASASNQKNYEDFLKKYADFILQDEEACAKLPSFFKNALGHEGAVFGLNHLGRTKGLLFLCSFKLPKKELRNYLTPFDFFINSQTELAFKSFELNNFYETVHPRALALSTMHSVHRVISSSLRLDELLPRIGRLSAQVLKGQGCSIMLVDTNNEYLIPHFAFGKSSKFIHKQRVRIGRGIQGRIAKTGEFHLTRRSIGVPFIEEDVVGVMVLWDKLDKQPFTRMDLEILRSLSEQAVVAIKNAQLYEETERLTLGSIKTINELLDESLSGESRGHLPIFGTMVMEVGKEMGLSGRELTNLQRAILLLNTGALTLRQKIWQKKGKLTKKEFAQIKRIPMKGASLLKSISSLKPVIPVILHHRERYDGSGYPQRLKGEEIPIGARIVSVVDSFIAMISRSSYRESLSVDAAIKELKDNSGSQFDPHVVQCFLNVLEREEILKEIIKTGSSRGSDRSKKER